MTPPRVFRHPAWCSQEHCTADPAGLAEYMPASGGAHRSAPVKVGTFAATIDGSVEVTAHLSNSVAPWETTTWLKVRTGPQPYDYISLDVDRARASIGALLDAARADAWRQEVAGVVAADDAKRAAEPDPDPTRLAALIDERETD